MNILIAIPTFENICPEVFKAVYDLDKCGHDVSFEYVKGYDCAKARNTIAKKAIDGKYDYVLMVDSDTIIPKRTLRYLLDPEADVVVGCCPKKNTKTKQTALCSLKDNPPGKGYHKGLTYDDLDGKTERIELKGGGGACLLVRVSVFKKMAYPYFKYVVYPDGSALSEDFYFCGEARKAGYKVWADPRVKCGHLARYFQYE